jgi:hypothetical protein
VSNDELTRFVTKQLTYLQEQFDALTRQINGMVTRIEHVEQRPPPVQPKDDDDAFEYVDPDEERL